MPLQANNLRKSFFVEKSALFSWAASAYILFSFFRFYIEDQTIYLLITILSISLGLVCLSAAALHKPINSAIAALVFTFFLLGLFILLFDRNNILQVLPQFLSHLGYAWILIYARFNTKLLSGILFLLIGFFILKMLSGADPEDVFTISRNYISVIMILSISFYIFACQQDGKIPSLLPLSMAMIILLWAIGRAGILSGAIILLGVLLLSKKHFFMAAAIAISLWGAVSIFQPNTADSIGQLTVGLERFERLSTQSQREFINKEYIESISTYPTNLLLGAPLRYMREIQEVDGNPHNAFINLHITFGLLGVIAFCITSTIAAINLYRNKEFLLILILFVGCFRSIFDSTAFHGPMDVVIFYCIFKGLKDCRSLSRNGGM